jgi:hypothetical protein
MDLREVKPEPSSETEEESFPNAQISYRVHTPEPKDRRTSHSNLILSGVVAERVGYIVRVWKEDESAILRCCLTELDFDVGKVKLPLFVFAVFTPLALDNGKMKGVKVKAMKKVCLEKHNYERHGARAAQAWAPATLQTNNPSSQELLLEAKTFVRHEQIKCYTWKLRSTAVLAPGPVFVQTFHDVSSNSLCIFDIQPRKVTYNDDDCEQIASSSSLDCGLTLSFSLSSQVLSSSTSPASSSSPSPAVLASSSSILPLSVPVVPAQPMQITNAFLGVLGRERSSRRELKRTVPQLTSSQFEPPVPHADFKSLPPQANEPSTLSELPPSSKRRRSPRRRLPAEGHGQVKQKLLSDLWQTASSSSLSSMPSSSSLSSSSTSSSAPLPIASSPSPSPSSSSSVFSLPLAPSNVVVGSSVRRQRMSQELVQGNQSYLPDYKKYLDRPAWKNTFRILTTQDFPEFSRNQISMSVQNGLHYRLCIAQDGWTFLHYRAFHTNNSDDRNAIIWVAQNVKQAFMYKSTGISTATDSIPEGSNALHVWFGNYKNWGAISKQGNTQVSPIIYTTSPCVLVVVVVVLVMMKVMVSYLGWWWWWWWW